MSPPNLFSNIHEVTAPSRTSSTATMASPDSSSRAELPQQQWYDIKLMEILPRCGFIFVDDHEILDSRSDAILKWAIETQVPSFGQHEVEELLADVMIDVNAVADYYAKSSCMYVDLDGEIRVKPVQAIFEAARKEHKWSNYVPRNTFVDFFQKLFRARSIYNMLMSMKRTPEAAKGEQSKLALSIDEWNSTSPTEYADAYFAQMPPHKLHRLFEILLGRDSADLGLGDASVIDSDNDMEDGSYEAKDKKGKGVYKEPAEDEEDLGDPNAPWIPWTPSSWKSVGDSSGDSSPTDEDAPWVHHYVQGSQEEHDMEDALGATNGFLSFCIHQNRRLLRY
ncbi:uncharacterized protein F4807DRAFT_418421 [Annulohypoxylon truncatum]|uniref:uncharacterized protein n=1 Tax=Annulohypoxylon truncatum TaxID=327061 RepID=UPI00200787A2|nr:uncharacterized protein F4807DRAFT_418421 [Annulohypoxylon truncatum]KAI1211602.1 hypothetical protein F4807DRAFT_418421 [Annulohypoxylon truncatum]